VLLICQRGCKRFRWAKRSWKTSRRTADDETTESLRRLDNIRTVGSRRATRAKNKQCLSRQSISTYVLWCPTLFKLVFSFVSFVLVDLNENCGLVVPNFFTRQSKGSLIVSYPFFIFKSNY
jgi:hypothetical protein